MVIPTKNFYVNKGNDKLFLYDQEGLTQVLERAFNVFSESEKQTAILGVHKGYLAGQNLDHLHFHLLSAKPKF